MGCHVLLQEEDIPDPGIKPRSPALALADSLPSEPLERIDPLISKFSKIKDSFQGKKCESGIL